MNRLLFGGPKGALDGGDGLGEGFVAPREIQEELRDGAAGAGIAGMGSDFVQRDEDEGALGEARVRDFQAGLADDQIAVEENVEVEGTGAVGDLSGAVAAKVALDREESGEEIARGKIRFEGDDGVEEAGLINKAWGETDRGGGVERGARGDAAEGGEALGGGGERGFGRAGGAGQVGAEGDVGKRHRNKDSGASLVGGVSESAGRRVSKPAW